MRRAVIIIALVSLCLVQNLTGVTSWTVSSYFITHRAPVSQRKSQSTGSSPSTTMSLQHRHQHSKSASSKTSTSLKAETLLGATSGAAATTREGERRRRQRQISVAAILASCFLNLLGFTMASPITPALGKHFALDMGASFGSLTSAYPLGMLVGLLFWP